LKTPAASTRTPALDAEVEDLGGARLVEQRAAAGKQQPVEVDALDDVGGHRCVVRAEADRLHHALLAEPHQRRIRARDRLVEVVIGVVHVEQVDAVETESLEARVH